MTHIRLIAPSWHSSNQDVALTKSCLEEEGMQVSVPDNLLGKDLLCAHQDDVRLSHLKDALSDPSVDIIWLLNGGYGLTRIIPDLLNMKKPEKEKLFIGFSDGSVLHQFLNQFWDWPSLHGPAARQLWKKTVGVQTIQETLRILKEGLDSYNLPACTPLNAQAKQMPFLSGKVVGGNLCLATCSLGTPWQMNAAGKILFFEDIDERGYRVDRMLMHLQQAHVFDRVKAILFGDFVRGEEADGSSLVEPVLNRFAETIDLPVFRLSGCGHGEENFPLPFNMPLRLSVEKT